MSDQQIIDLIRDVEVPDCRKVGRYAFFAVCGFSVGNVAWVMMMFLDVPRAFANPINTLFGLATFLALREMSKQWDFVLQLSAKSKAGEA